MTCLYLPNPTLLRRSTHTCSTVADNAYEVVARTAPRRLARTDAQVARGEEKVASEKEVARREEIAREKEVARGRSLACAQARVAGARRRKEVA